MITIVIPLFNREKLIAATLESILRQTYQHWEVLVVDDGSTDGSKTIVKDYSTKDSRIQLLQRKDFGLPKGAPSCRNIGIESASGDYIIFLDSDDLLLQETLKNRVKHIVNHQESDFLVFNGAFFTETIEDSEFLWNRFTDESDLQRFLRGDVVWSISGPIWKHNYLHKSNLRFDVEAKSSQDWEFHINALLGHPNYAKIESEPDYFVRRDETANDRISKGHYSGRKYLNRIFLIEKFLRKIKARDQYLALHKHLVRDTISSLRNDLSEEVLKSFRRINTLFPSSIKKGWRTIINLVYFSLKQKSSLPLRLSLKYIDFFHPSYQKNFKLGYRSAYKKTFDRLADQKINTTNN